jgi:hypothetical protein
MEHKHEHEHENAHAATPPLKSSFFPCLMNPLTALTEGVPLNTVEGTIDRILHGFEMPFEKTKFQYHVDAVFTSGYARFSVRLWSAAEDANFYVEVMRRSGDRIVVTRFFQILQSVLKNPTEEVISRTIGSFHVSMLDWVPAPAASDLVCLWQHQAFFLFFVCFGDGTEKFPPNTRFSQDEHDDGFPPLSSTTEEGSSSLVLMVSSPFDDVACDGCGAVSKLAASYKSSRRSMAASRELMAALVGVVLSSNAEKSFMTRAIAALSLQELTVLREGQASFLAVCATSGDMLPRFGVVASLVQTGSTFQEWFLQRYWYAMRG